MMGMRLCASIHGKEQNDYLPFLSDRFWGTGPVGSGPQDSKKSRSHVCLLSRFELPQFLRRHTPRRRRIRFSSPLGVSGAPRLKSGSVSLGDLDALLSDCIQKFRNGPIHRNDPEFLNTWIIDLDTREEDFKNVAREMDDSDTWPENPLFYELYAVLLEARGRLHDAIEVYRIGIPRCPDRGRLEKARALFLDRMDQIVAAATLHKVDDVDISQLERDHVNPWAATTIKDLLEKMKTQLTGYQGYHGSSKAYSGKVALSSRRGSSRNKIIELGRKKYQIKGYGRGGFADVFKAYISSDPEEVVALKIQKLSFPWEFYMYCQLYFRIEDPQRQAFGFGRGMYEFSDYSVLICDYLSHGNLQDSINVYVFIGKTMEEVICMYYTIEMVRMLETLHSVGILHGELLRSASCLTTADLFVGFNFATSICFAVWGLCLVDWGRGIDTRLFPENTEFKGDCRTSGFRCIEMHENKPWTYQVDRYGLCVIVHVMLHGSYLEVEKKTNPDGSFFYQPKSHYIRYWNVDLWRNLFSKLLNIGKVEDEVAMSRSIRQSFEEHLNSSKDLIKQLKDLLVKQKTSFLSA
ncbi:hypothetical protein MLD38_009171 [Melastoma candidum]|nr:hypothetical protein MLD38_009171 [Melastoma candidum]